MLPTGIHSKHSNYLISDDAKWSPPPQFATRDVGFQILGTIGDAHHCIGQRLYCGEDTDDCRIGSARKAYSLL